MKRRLAIAELVRSTHSVRVNDLVDRFEVSSVTIRSDLGYLEDRGYLIRSFGGAVSTGKHRAEVPRKDKHSIALSDADSIRQTLIELLPLQGAVFLGGPHIAQWLLPEAAWRSDLTIASDVPSITSQIAFYPGARLFIVGGPFKPAVGVCVLPTEQSIGLEPGTSFVPVSDDIASNRELRAHYETLASASRACWGVAIEEVRSASAIQWVAHFDGFVIAPSTNRLLLTNLESVGFTATHFEAWSHEHCVLQRNEELPSALKQGTSS